MSALVPGKKAPDFSLPALDSSDKHFSLSEALKSGPVLLVFFKVSCPVCQFAMPYVDRIARAYGDKGRVIGISQDSAGDTMRFARQYNVSFRVVLDDTAKYKVSNAYGLTNVPSLFYISPDGKIELTSVGWSKKDVETASQKFAKAAAIAEAAVFRPKEDVTEFKPG